AAEATAAPVEATAATTGPAASPAAGLATPVGAASPSAGSATPVGNAIAYTPEICASVADWLTKPVVAGALAEPRWTQVLAEGEKAAAGEPVDVEQMKTVFASLDGVASDMRDEAGADIRHGSVTIASQMIGRSARLAGGLADGTETQADAQAAVTELRDLIAAYEADTAARGAACGA
ncbi:MAG: hypothetical protein KC442_10470, partial [Thermomicrobiales bacterium]|nr:hypothetical protein [Thermomicrobiales bacterium]